jgi:hypothetical protein
MPSHQTPPSGVSATFVVAVAAFLVVLTDFAVAMLFPL